MREERGGGERIVKGLYCEENIFQRREVIKSFPWGKRRGGRKRADNFSFIERGKLE